MAANDPAKKKAAKKPRVTRPVKATEIKSFFYAWCGQRGMKPEYDIRQKGIQPEVTFTCRLYVDNLDHEEYVEASNKKDAQTRAAWNYVDHLVETNQMYSSELPQRPTAPVIGEAPTIGSKIIKNIKETREEIFKHGGWDLTNSKQRLNQLSQRVFSTPTYEHYTVGPEHARIFTCSLRLQVYSIQKEFTAQEQGTSKRQSSAMCALSMARQLFHEGLLERAGDPFKAVDYKYSPDDYLPPALNYEPEVKKKPSSSKAAPKRKAEEEVDVDEYGNYTLETSQLCLNNFCNSNGIKDKYDYKEETAASGKLFTASLNFKVESKTFGVKIIKSTYSFSSKKVASQGCALLAVAQLYHFGLIEAYKNPSKEKKSDKKVDDELSTFNDHYIFRKHQEIYPSDEEIDSMQEALDLIENCLREVAEKVKKLSIQFDHNNFLRGVIRTGTVARGTVLKDELQVELALLSTSYPSKSLVSLVFTRMPEHLPKHYDLYHGEGFIKVFNYLKSSSVCPPGTHPVEITILFTSPIMRIYEKNPDMSTLVSTNGRPPSDMLDPAKCLQVLAQLRRDKWFECYAGSNPYCVVIIRLLKNLAKSSNEWAALDDWALELLTARILESSSTPLTAGLSIQRVFEAIGSGILLPESNGIIDPCEKSQVDVIGSMALQSREDLTLAAQTALRKFVFYKPHLVFGELSNQGNDEAASS